LDATDSIENQGNSLTRPFKTIQRALIESARFSYQKGLNNDRFGKTTILLYPGDHIVDNRPGWIPDGVNNYRLRNGTTSNDFPPFDLTSVFDLSVPDNDLYKLNSIHGGVIIPRGTSLVGLDLRKTKIRPKYIPNPVNDNIERSALFRITGGCYLWQFSMFDADPNGQCYLDYTTNTFVPNFSHHKLTCFEYADGVNGVNINDTFQVYSSTRTDLDMYYEKVGLAYGTASGRSIEPDYPSIGLDIRPKIDEYRIVGSTGQSVGISSIKSGDGITSTNIITVTTTESVAGLDVDTPFRVEGVTASGYSGQFVVSEKLSATEIAYQVQNPPSNPLPTVTGSNLILSSDTVTGASPYIFNLSLRSVFGMCGVLADGNKATGFKSMVLAQFTGIGLQKDDNAFVKFNETSGAYDDSTVSGNENLHTNSRSIFKPSYRNFHIKAINGSLLQNVSIFAIGFAEHFVTESGADMSITNSNSNFGARALVASGFKPNAFAQDDLGYISHIIPPKQVSIVENSIEFNSIDVAKTVGVSSIGSLYLYEQNNSDTPPPNVIQGYRFGSGENDKLKVLVAIGGTVTEYESRIVMPRSQDSSSKKYSVNYNISNVLSFDSTHNLQNGESIRIFGKNGQLPDGLENNRVYFAITDTNDVGIGNTQIKVAKSLSDALSHTASTPSNLTFNTIGDDLSVVSRVSDKSSGDIGHPIQFDFIENQWYVQVSSASTDNAIYSTVNALGTASLGSATARTFFNRKLDNRNAVDTIYRYRYVIPKNNGGSIARPPTEGFVLQESGTSIATQDAEIQTYFGSGSLSNENQQRNFRFVSSVNWTGGTANVTTELPHNLTSGSEVQLNQITSTNNTTGKNNSGFNGSFVVSGITSSRTFTVGISTDPGDFTNNVHTRNTSLPYFQRKRYENTYYVYRESEIQPYVAGEQDGVYYLTTVNSSNSPNVSPFTGENFSQPVKELYPQTNRDNPDSDPAPSVTHASSDLIGETKLDDVRKSLTRETIDKKYRDDRRVAVGVTDITSSSSTDHIIFTDINHGLNRVTRLSVVSAGLGYGSGSVADLYNAELVSIGASTTGEGATAKVSVNASGQVQTVVVMNGGSGYGIGNTLAVKGLPTFGSPTDAVVEVTKIYDNVGEVVKVGGISSETYKPFNDLYRITEVPIGIARSFNVVSANTINSGGSSGLVNSETTNAFLYSTGEAIRVNSIDYDRFSGIATVGTDNFHGLSVDNVIRLTGANEEIYNGNFVVNNIVGTSGTFFTLNLGIGTYSPTATGTIFGYRTSGSNGGNVTSTDENLNGRMNSMYAGITTTLASTISDITGDVVAITNLQSLDFKIGDYFTINQEIFRIKDTVAPTDVSVGVFRGVLGSGIGTHSTNSVIRKIDANPVELRRHSISRASGHTFEYVGFGPGNYSTALPDRQDRQISDQEELLAQSLKRDGGINFYTGMNDKGISYNGNKKMSTITGQEEIFDTPIQTVTGEDISNFEGINVINPIEALFNRSIKVEGGSDGNATSEFSGPVIFSNKITSTSTKGMEANSLFLQGDTTVSRKYTVGISTPTLAGNPGDVVYNANPDDGGYVGWIYSVSNNWRRFSGVSLDSNANIALFDKVGIATTTIGNCTLKVGSGTTLFCVDGDGVGIGSTANSEKLRIIGNADISGSVVAAAFTGDGSGLTNLANDSRWEGVAAGLGTGIYPQGVLKVGIGTTRPNDDVDLTVGAVGSSGTTMHVYSEARFVGIITANDATVTGFSTVIGNYEIQNTSGQIIAGIVTTTDLVVGTSGTVITTSSANIGVGTATARAKLDVEGLSRFKTTSANQIDITSSSGVVTLDLASSQVFNLTTSEDVTQFTVQNIPSDCSSFTLKITQGASGSPFHTVDFDDVRDNGGSALAVRWPGGGLLPILSPSVSGLDIYTYKTFDGGTTWYAFVVGQNFA
jgi:hypothetical protein